MAPRKKLTYTRDAEVLWSGEPPEDFKANAEKILGRELSEEAWSGLCGVLLSYSFLLNHEHHAAPLAEQKAAVVELSKAAHLLLALVRKADSGPLGRLVSYRVASRWNDLRNRTEEHNQKIQTMQRDVADLLRRNGCPAPDTEAETLVGRWRESDVLTPSPTPKRFIEELSHFCDTVRLVVAEIKGAPTLSKPSNGAWIEHIGTLTEWMAESGFPTGASKRNPQEARRSNSRTNGKITALVIAINKLIPSQMRRPEISDDSLAGSIIKAQQEYKKNRPETPA